MKKTIIFQYGILLCLLFFVSTSSYSQEKFSFIPQPLKIETGMGSMEINRGTKVQFKGVNLKLGGLASNLTQTLEKQTGIHLQISNTSVTGNFIRLEQLKDSTLGEEGYKLVVNSKGITISGNTSNGIYYGVQTLLQLIPVSKLEICKVPALTIVDKPRFKWRGMLLDCCNHFYTFETVKKFIDLMAMYKMNTLQWHLVDNLGWRIEIKKYPKLTDIGAWRVDREIFHSVRGNRHKRVKKPPMAGITPRNKFVISLSMLQSGR